MAAVKGAPPNLPRLRSRCRSWPSPPAARRGRSSSERTRQPLRGGRPPGLFRAAGSTRCASNGEPRRARNAIPALGPAGENVEAERQETSPRACCPVVKPPRAVAVHRPTRSRRCKSRRSSLSGLARRQGVFALERAKPSAGVLDRYRARHRFGKAMLLARRLARGRACP